MILVVISYPGHYHITQLAIKQAIKNMGGITAVHIVWDDANIPAPHDYIPFSSIVQIPPYIKGWYRQQIVKLNLHKVFPNKELVVMDGDVIFHTIKHPKAYFYAPLLGPEIKSYSKAKEVLGIDQYDFLACGFMYVESKWLELIHKTNPNINQIYQNIAMSNWNIDGRWPLSEWEVIHDFVTDVLKIKIATKPFEYEMLKTNEFEAKFDNTKDIILDGTDNLSKEFYLKNGIEINENIWNATY